MDNHQRFIVLNLGRCRFLNNHFILSKQLLYLLLTLVQLSSQREQGSIFFNYLIFVIRHHFIGVCHEEDSGFKLVYYHLLLPYLKLEPRIFSL